MLRSMRHIPLALVAAATVSACLAGAGFVSVGHAGAASNDLGGFGGHIAHARVAPIWREGRTPAVPALHRVVCATAVLGDDSACYEASTSR
jgi:hypothetical protein